MSVDLTLLAASWKHSWQALGAKGGAEDAYQALLAAYQQPHRHYHTLQHLTECLRLWQQCQSLAEQPAEVAMALWFHDAVYQIPGAGNEAKSADWAVSVLTAAKVAAPQVERIRQLILATAHQAQPEVGDQQLIVAIDLAILAADSPRFAEYEQQIRAEYRRVPWFLYRRKRRQILQQFLARPILFEPPLLHQQFEAKARQNLHHRLG